MEHGTQYSMKGAVQLNLKFVIVIWVCGLVRGVKIPIVITMPVNMRLDVQIVTKNAVLIVRLPSVFLAEILPA